MWGMWIYFVFMAIILMAIVLRRKPMLIGAVGLFVVGALEYRDIFQGAQSVFRAILITAIELLPVILLIGLVSALTKLLQNVQADELMARPFVKLRHPAAMFFGVGVAAWILTLFLWPTPAVSLLGAVLVSVLASNRVPPLGLAVCLCVCAEGAGLSGDLVIQEAPGLVARAAGISVTELLPQTYVLVAACGLVACILGFWRYKISVRAMGAPSTAAGVGEEQGSQGGEGGYGEEQALQEEGYQTENNRTSTSVEAGGTASQEFGKVHTRRRLAVMLFMLMVFGVVIVWLLLAGVRGSMAAATVGGAAVLVLVVGTLLQGLRSSLTQFVALVKEGMMFSMGVFGPIVIIAAFFMWGTQLGAQEIFQSEGDGYLAQLISSLSSAVALQSWSALLLVMAAGVVGAMSGSGFSALPLVGGLAYALAQSVPCSTVALAAAGQITAIWTGALIVPWGFPALAGAITRVDSGRLAKENVVVWAGVLVTTFVLSWGKL